jgi:sodium/potassium-transporting ATPase subunit alpha
VFVVDILQAAAGLFAFFVVMNDYGYPPHILLSMGSNDYWGKMPLFCKFQGGKPRPSPRHESHEQIR